MNKQLQYFFDEFKGILETSPNKRPNMIEVDAAIKFVMNPNIIEYDEDFFDADFRLKMNEHRFKLGDHIEKIENKEYISLEKFVEVFFAETYFKRISINGKYPDPCLLLCLFDYYLIKTKKFKILE